MHLPGRALRRNWIYIMIRRDNVWCVFGAFAGALKVVRVVSNNKVVPLLLLLLLLLLLQ